MSRKLITARATVNLNGLRAGETAQVDPTEPRIAALLRTELLVDEDPIYVEPPPAAQETQADEPTTDEPQVEPAPPRARARRTASEDSTST